MKKRAAPFTLPATPIDRHEVSYFRVLGTWEDPYVVHVRCVYHVHSKWAEVFPDRTKEYGRDFENEWQVFTNGECAGRSGEGWEAVLGKRDSSTWEGCFATHEEAKTHALLLLADCLVETRKKVTDVEQRIAEMRANRERSFAQCPDCVRKPDEVSHPTGMIFVGMGHGWQPCSRCEGSGQIETTALKEREP